jgi:hypothetical protein
MKLLKCSAQVGCQLRYIPLVDLVAAKLLEIALDMTDEGDVHDNGADEHDQR